MNMIQLIFYACFQYTFLYFIGHFLGNETVIDRLKQQGYSIEHVQHDDTIPR